MFGGDSFEFVERAIVPGESRYITRDADKMYQIMQLDFACKLEVVKSTCAHVCHVQPRGEKKDRGLEKGMLVLSSTIWTRT